MAGDSAAMFCAEFRGIEFARRTNRRDLRLPRCVDGRDMGGRDPAITEDADVVFFHGNTGFDGIAFNG